MVNQIYPDNCLDLWFREQNPDNFPDSKNYKDRLSLIVGYLEENIYPEVKAAAIWSAIQKKDVPIYLNDHGKAHADKVISRAAAILNESNCRLGFYEAYLFLVAAYMHDIGIIYGRNDHENKCNEILLKMGSIAGEDNTEKRIISKIATAHGGEINGNRDTLNCLQKDYVILDKKFRKQFIAALLRFADELADDRTRASRFLLEEKRLRGSEVYHAYSYAIRSVEISERNIKLKFELNKAKALNKCKKVTKSKTIEHVYLLNEILDCTKKMHFERMYCMRFLGPEIRIENISVEIEIYDNKYMKKFEDHTISYELKEIGYPNYTTYDIYDLCPDDLKDVNGRKKDGEWLKDRLSS